MISSLQLRSELPQQCDIVPSKVSGKGLEVVAREALPAGFQVLLEPAYAFVVRHAYTNTFCEHCLSKISATASTSDMMRVSTRYIRFQVGHSPVISNLHSKCRFESVRRMPAIVLLLTRVRICARGAASYRVQCTASSATDRTRVRC